jgi:hypothetical protein
MPNDHDQLLILIHQISNSYLMICVRQVETLPVNHTLHNLHFRASELLLGFKPTTNIPFKSAVLILPPVLDFIFGLV